MSRLLRRSPVAGSVLALTLALAMAEGGPARTEAHVHTRPTGGQGLGQGSPSHQSASLTLSVARALGHVLIAPVAVGSAPPAGLLQAIRQGHIGSVILFGQSLAPGEVRTVTGQLQAAARAGHNPGLLIMTDQEGGLVHRLSGPPTVAADQMSNPNVAGRQGTAAGRLLRSAGVNVDLAPVADVSRNSRGFIALQHRSFGSSPAVVAAAACSFARGLRRAGVAYTLKHFPGLGSATQSTDNGPVAVSESRSQISADDQAYRRCGSDPHGLVMISNASYPHLTGTTPAVLSRSIYGSVLPADGVHAVTISDAIDAGAMAPQPHPALRSLSAGLDLVMYTSSDSEAEAAYGALSTDIAGGLLSRARIRQAAARVLALKAALGLPK